MLPLLLLLGPATGAEQQSQDRDRTKFLGKFQRYQVDKYDEYLEALGVNVVKRKALVAANPTLENRKSGDTWTTILSTTLKNWEIEYQLGQTIHEETPDGRQVETVVDMEDDKMVMKQKAKTRGEHNTKVERKFAGDEIVETDMIEGMNIVATQRYKRL